MLPKPNSWGNFKYAWGCLRNARKSRTTSMPSSCFGHWSIFKVTLMKTPHGKCTEQSLNFGGNAWVIVSTSHHYRWARFISVTGNTGFLQSTDSEDIASGPMPCPSIFFNPLPCSINMITKVNLKFIMPAYSSITHNSAFADTGSHSYYDNSS